MSWKVIIVQDLHNALCTASELGDYFSANELEDHIVQGTWKIIKKMLENRPEDALGTLVKLVRC